MIVFLTYRERKNTNVAVKSLTSQKCVDTLLAIVQCLQNSIAVIRNRYAVHAKIENTFSRKKKKKTCINWKRRHSESYWKLWATVCRRISCSQNETERKQSKLSWVKCYFVCFDMARVILVISHYFLVQQFSQVFF